MDVYTGYMEKLQQVKEGVDLTIAGIRDGSITKFGVQTLFTSKGPCCAMGHVLTNGGLDVRDFDPHMGPLGKSETGTYLWGGWEDPDEPDLFEDYDRAFSFVETTNDVIGGDVEEMLPILEQLAYQLEKFLSESPVA